MKQNQIRINIVPPKIKDLSVKSIWRILRDDEELIRYFPDSCVENEPPRTYFFSILCSIRPEIFENIIIQAENKYWKKEQENNQSVAIHHRVLNELNTITIKNSLLSKRIDKRVSFTSKAKPSEEDE